LGEGVTVYPIDRWVNLMPDRFGSQNLLWLGPRVSLVVVCRLVAVVYWSFTEDTFSVQRRV